MTIWLSRWYQREANTQAYLWYQGFAGNRAQTTPGPPFFLFSFTTTLTTTTPAVVPESWNVLVLGRGIGFLSRRQLDRRDSKRTARRGARCVRSFERNSTAGSQKMGKMCIRFSNFVIGKRTVLPNMLSDIPASPFRRYLFFLFSRLNHSSNYFVSILAFRELRSREESHPCRNTTQTPQRRPQRGHPQSAAGER